MFAKEKVTSEEALVAMERMNEQIKNVGGRLTFTLKIDKDGWVARCKEFDGIVTGGASKNPSEKDIVKSIIEAVKTAFDVPICKLEIREEKQESGSPRIKLIREFQFC